MNTAILIELGGTKTTPFLRAELSKAQSFQLQKKRPKTIIYKLATVSNFTRPISVAQGVEFSLTNPEGD